MPNTGIEPATLRSLARLSDQLSYAAAFVKNKVEANARFSMLNSAEYLYS